MSAQCKAERFTLFARVAGTLCRPGPAEQTAGSLPGWDSDSALSPGWSREKKNMWGWSRVSAGLAAGLFSSSFLFQTTLKLFEFKFNLNSSHTQINKIMHQHECTTC